MNALGIALVWCAAQVTLVSILAAVVYVAARKIGPSARALVALTCLLLVVGLSTMALSPWPRWSIVTSPDETNTVAGQPEPEFDSSDIFSSTDEQTPDEIPAQFDPANSELVPLESFDQSDDLQAFATAFWNGFVDDIQPTPKKEEAATGRRWPGTLAVVFLGGALLGLLRILYGLKAVGGYRRQSRPVEDPELLELVDELRAALNCRRTIEVRESADLATAATTGWRRPLILLPSDWRSWTENERRAVLAHEVAHISRNDFLAWICAQVGLVLHFYHPLVHWLCRRLKLEQELAADAAAAALVGGQRTYLLILAGMALRQSERPLSWPARTFLPTRGTFLRRIEMLRDSKHLTTTLSAGTRMLTVGILALAALAAAGLRPPGETNNPLQAAEPAAKQAAKSEAKQAALGPIELSYVPKETIAVLSVRPAQILGRPEYKELAKLLDQPSRPFSKFFGITVSKIDQLSWVVVRLTPFNQAFGALFPMTPFGGMRIRMSEPHDFVAPLRKYVPNLVERTVGGRKYYLLEKTPSTNSSVAFFQSDDRTLIADSEENLLQLLAAGKKPQSKLVTGDNWKRIRNGQLAAVVDVQAFSKILGWMKNGQRDGRPAAMPLLLTLFAPLTEETDAIYTGIALDKKLKLTGAVICKNDAGAGKVTDTVNAGLTLAKNSLDQLRGVIRNSPQDDNQRARAMTLLPLAEELTREVKIEHKGKTVRFSTIADFDPALVKLLTNGTFQAREASRQATSRNNLKQIAMAMHNYHELFGRFPPAVVQGPGQKPHSWRVALLPLLDQRPLYNEYKFDEPWDSVNNKKVFKKMPAVYRHPSDTSNKNVSSYYVLTGKGTAFEGKEGIRYREFTDGLRNTLMVVEAKRDIPWTALADIDFHTDKAPPEFGGFEKGGFNALLADGRAIFVPNGTDVETMKRLIQRNDGKPVEIPDVTTGRKIRPRPAVAPRRVIRRGGTRKTESGRAVPRPAPRHALTVTIKNRKIRVNKKVVDLPALRQIITKRAKSAQKQNETLVVLIRTDKELPSSDVLSVLKAGKGLTNVQFNVSIIVPERE